MHELHVQHEPIYNSNGSVCNNMLVNTPLNH